ncbi:MAG: phasin family protein [Alphaproteobacteria bacterium]
MKSNKVASVAGGKPAPVKPARKVEKATVTVEPAVRQDTEVEAMVGTAAVSVDEISRELILNKPAATEAKVTEKAKPQTASRKTAARDVEDVVPVKRENVETVVDAATAVFRCWEELGAEWMNYAKSTIEDGMSVSHALMECTTVEEAFDLQNRYVKNAVDGYLSESTKLSEISLRMASEALAPLGAAFKQTVETLNPPTAR